VVSIAASVAQPRVLDAGAFVHRRGDRVVQARLAHRLGQELGHARLAGRGVPAARRGQHHQAHRAQRRRRRDAARELDAVHARHVVVQHRHVEGVALVGRPVQGGERVVAVGAARDAHPPRAEVGLQDPAVGRGVVDGEDLQPAQLDL
jgi:hypothetical protein